MPPRFVSLVVLALLAPGAAARASEPPRDRDRATPPGGRVDFAAHVRPILQARCLSCHSRGKYKGGLSLETRAALLRGGESGPAVVPGRAADSLLVRMIAGQEEGRRMPQKGAPLDPEQITLLRRWVDQGAGWPKGLDFGFRQAPVEPRRPEIPGDPNPTGLTNPVDRFLARGAERRNSPIRWEAVSDRVFLRRVSLDLVGLIPTPERIAAFEADRDPRKRAEVVRRLLDDNLAYADHWLTFWNDALRNAYRGTGFIDGGRKTITTWLYRALVENKPFDRFARELVSPPPGSGAEGFTKGIVWRGVVNASQAPPVQAAQNVSQVFLGTNLKCASCHDSFVNHWKLTDAYALASVFADRPLELHRCDKPTGETSKVGFIYPQLGTIDADAPRDRRMSQLADVLTSSRNGRFSRTIVNRLWAQLMGRGLVEPLDDMDRPAWDQDLLDWLASDLADHGYDLKHTLELIATSRAYQLPSVGLESPTTTEPYVFRGPRAKRMTAEQFVDAISLATGAWDEPSPPMLKVDGRGQGGQLAQVRSKILGGGPLPVRAALCFDDPLLAALGRTNREQVVTRRESVATTLQALELLNGATLDHKLREASRRWFAAPDATPEGLVRRAFLGALGREPTDAERETALELVGRPATAEGLQDLLWTVVMLPEFQIVP